MVNTPVASKIQSNPLAIPFFPLSLTCLCVSAYWNYNRKSKTGKYHTYYVYVQWDKYNNAQQVIKQCMTLAPALLPLQ